LDPLVRSILVGEYFTTIQECVPRTELVYRLINVTARMDTMVQTAKTIIVIQYPLIVR